MPRNDQKYWITIKNWDQHQREMRGGEKRRRRREWIAISVDLFSDPDFLELDHVHARLWLGLLLHAGKVGPEFSMTPARAVSMFCLRRPCDFMILKNQGFINLQADTNKTDRTNKTVQNSKPPKEVAARPIQATLYPEGLNNEAWEQYVAHRRDIKAKKLTDKGAYQAMKKWSICSLEAQLRAVESSIANGWTGCFPEKEMPGRGKETPYDKLQRELAELNQKEGQVVN